MVGFLGALAGGAMQGWSAGRLEEIKQQREEKLHWLDQQFAHQENELTRGLQREQIASTEKLAEAQRLSNEQMEKLRMGTTERIATAGNVSQESIAAANRAMQEHIAGLTTTNAKQIAQMQIDAQKELNSSFVQMQDGSFKLKIGSELRDIGTDPETGKPLVPLANDNDTPEMKNYKFLISTGVPPEAARQIFTSKTADPTLIQSRLAEAYLNAKSVFGMQPGDDAAAADWAEQTYKRFEQANKPTAAPTAPGETPTEPAAGGTSGKPAVPTSASDDQPTAEQLQAMKFPPGTTKEAAIAKAKAWLAQGKKRTWVAAVLRANGIDPTELGQ